MTRVTGLFRHPIKGVGREPLDTVTLTAGKTMPGDRVWAILLDRAKIDATHQGWAHCANFLRGAMVPSLVAVSARTGTDETLHLSHPALDDLSVDLNDPADAVRLLGWVGQLIPPTRSQPAVLLATPDRGMTDTKTPTVSIMSEASLRAMSQKAGHSFDAGRFRGNIWLNEGLAPWEEHEWIGRDITVGGTTLRVVGRIERCRSTTASAITGHEDFDTLHHLNSAWGHQDFGVHAEVVSGGALSVGDKVTV